MRWVKSEFDIIQMYILKMRVYEKGMHTKRTFFFFFILPRKKTNKIAYENNIKPTYDCVPVRWVGVKKKNRFNADVVIYLDEMCRD